MNYNVFVAKEALEDIFSLVRYVYQELCNPEAANRLYKELDREIKNLQFFPRRYTDTGIQYRGYVIYKKTYKSYLIFYFIDSNKHSIFIIRVLKDIMDWKRILGKIKVYHFT